MLKQMILAISLRHDQGSSAPEGDRAAEKVANLVYVPRPQAICLQRETHQ